ncbi:MAG: hypothetical protein AB2770_13215 [Candidatus Thiodiazotropha taylori]
MSADKLLFRLDDGNVLIELTDELGPVNTWKVTEGDCIQITTGYVDSEEHGFECKDVAQPYSKVITLFDASWDTTEGSTGKATVNYTQGCSPSSWTLEKKE